MTCKRAIQFRSAPGFREAGADTYPPVRFRRRGGRIVTSTEGVESRLGFAERQALSWVTIDIDLAIGITKRVASEQTPMVKL
jgi:hypothetical protein